MLYLDHSVAKALDLFWSVCFVVKVASGTEVAQSFGVAASEHATMG